MRPNGLGVRIDRATFAGEVRTNRRTKALIQNQVRRAGLRRFEAARDLVFALRARLEACESRLDAVLDALVIAGLEVQAVKVGRGTPVAAVKCIRGPEEDRAGDECSAPESGFHDEGLPESTRRVGKECARQIGLVAVTQEGVAMERIDRVEPLVGKLLTRPGFEPDAHLGNTPAFASGLLALVGGEAREIVIEGGVAPVVPVELAVAPAEPACLVERCSVGVIGKGRAPRRRLALLPAQRVGQAGGA